jgi:aryl-alcohol dehydrogenase-like predicted oxidoreductase
MYRRPGSRGPKRRDSIGRVISKRRFGASGVEVSEVGFGAWVLGLDWWGKVDEAEASRLVGAALDCGITFFDTADTYGAGVGEERLGAALRGHIGEVEIGTKFGYDITVPHDSSSHSERPTRWDQAFIRERCEDSLRRLGVDAIDLYELHNPRMDQITDDAIFELLEELKADGKIRSYGVALGPAIGWQDEGLWAIRNRKIDVVQTVFNMLEQEPGTSFLEAAEIEHAAAAPPAVIARVPHASDALTGTYTADTVFPATDHRSFRKREWLLRALQKVDRLGFLLDSRTIGQAAIAWLLANPGVASVLPTMTTVEQIKDFAAAASNPLTTDEFERAQALYRRDFDLPPPSADETIALRTSTP